MRRSAVRIVSLLPVALVVAPASARTSIHPYVEVQQVFAADLSGNSNDAVTYTGLAAGVDATVQSAKIQGQLDYRYDHYFAWSDRYRDSDTHNGLANFVYQATPDISLQAAGIASRARGTLSQGTPGLLFGNVGNTQQVYAVQAGPSFNHRFGELDVAADYRFGWTRTTDGIGTVDLGPGQPLIQTNFTTISHTVDASLGMRPGASGLPFGWTISGGYTRDEVHFLDEHFNDKFGRLDLVYPVTPTFALEGGVGYENGRASQAAILTDANGAVILDSHRHLRPDHSKPRLLSYDQDGLIWDVGVLWRPSPRTSLEIRGGRRYGERVVTGRLTYKVSPRASLEVVAYDDVQSFGRQLTAGIGGLPTAFSPDGLPIPSALSICVFGANGGQGGCLSALNSVNSNFYRSRGVYGVLSGTRGSWSYGLGVSYDHRHYLAPDLGPNVTSFAGVREQSVTVNGTIGRRLSPVSSVSASAVASWYDTDFLGSGSYTAYGVVGTYSREFSRRLLGIASLSVSSGATGIGTNDDVVGAALLALRYQL